MRPWSRFSTLLRFGLRSMPGSLWGFYAVYLLLLAIQILSLGDISSVGRAMRITQNIFWPYLIGSRFFSSSWPNADFTKSGLPHAEFIISRPILRRQAQLFFSAFYLILVAAPILISLVWCLNDPDLTLWTAQSSGQHTEAFFKLAEYQAQFPAGTMDRDKTGIEGFVIPDGNFFAVGLLLESVVLVALETLMCFQAPSWRKGKKLPPVLLLITMGTILATFQSTDDIPEHVFFFFSHHWGWFALGTVALAGLAFRTVGKEAAGIEA